MHTAETKLMKTKSRGIFGTFEEKNKKHFSFENSRKKETNKWYLSSCMFMQDLLNTGVIETM